MCYKYLKQLVELKALASNLQHDLQTFSGSKSFFSSPLRDVHRFDELRSPLQPSLSGFCHEGATRRNAYRLIYRLIT